MEAIGKAMQRNPLVSGDTERLNQQIVEKEMELRNFKCCTRMSYEEFKELMIVYSRETMLQRSIVQPFVVDKFNGPIIKQLYLYFIGSPDCEWNPNAGLIFAGNIGVGKTVMMKAFLRITDEYSRRRTTIAHAKQLAGMFKKDSVEHYSKRPMFVDDLGKEEVEVKDFGTITRPWTDLFALRYDEGARTYATTNFNLDDLKKIYGSFIGDRMGELMTLVPMPGESRRLKNEVKKGA